MAITYLPPSNTDGEPVYLYDDPNLHLIQLSGQNIVQRSMAIRMVITNPRDIDRICKVPTLTYDQNLDYTNNWGGVGSTAYQRKYDFSRLTDVANWWGIATSHSVNPAIVFLPAAHLFQDIHGTNITSIDISPASWTRVNCACGLDSSQYPGQPAGLHFDHCRGCGTVFRPATIIDGQHRIRGMSARETDRDHPFYVTVLSEAAPNATTAIMAARLFLEINGGVKALDDLHIHYLASGFSMSINDGLLDYSNTTKRAAYQIASELNQPAAMNEWSEDIGVNPRVGRVKMMDDGRRSDYRDVTKLAEWLWKTGFTSSVTIPSLIAANPPVTRTPMAVPAAGVSITGMKNILRTYLKAITDTWPGTTGAKTASKWYQHRGAIGDLQEGRVFNVMFGILPHIKARIDEQSLPFDLPNVCRELRAIQNITWDSSFDYLHATAGENRVINIIKEIYEVAPYPTPVSYWPNLATWMGGPLDPVTVSTFTSDITKIEFETLTVNPNPNGRPRTRSLVSKTKATCEYRNMSTGLVVRGISVTIRDSGVSTFRFSEHNVTPPSVGDSVELDMLFHSPYSSVGATVTGVTVVV